MLGATFLVSGTWKVLDLEATAERMVQTLVPVPLSVLAALSVTVAELVAGSLLLVPRYRRWGAMLAGLMLIAFMIYVGALYDRLLGQDCNCFPWIRRVVGPGFFAGDAAMLALAVVSGRSSERPRGWRGAAAIAFCALLLVGSSYAATTVSRSGAEAPAEVTVDGRRFPLRDGRVLLFFFDPECLHCYDVARGMARRDWGRTRLVVVPMREPQFATVFLADTGLRAGVSPEAAVLGRVFPFAEPPFAVALDGGRMKARFNAGELADDAWYGTLERLGYLR
jgi:hypothetical protein